MDSTAAPTPALFSPIHRLPNEILAHILRSLDSPSNVQKNLVLDPTNITRPVDGSQTGFDTPVKTASLVCRLWRRSLLQLLFRNIVWAFDRFHKPSGRNLRRQIEVLDFLHSTGLSRAVESFTILIDTPERSIHGMLGDELLGLLPQRNSLPSSTTLTFQAFTESRGLHGEYNSPEEEEYAAHRAFQLYQEELAYRADPEFYQEPEPVPEVAHDNNWLWHLIFEQLDPLQITLISSVKTLCSLLSRSVDLLSDWASNSQRHIVSLSRTSRFRTGQSKKTPVALLPSQRPRGNAHTAPSDLFSIRDWTSLLVNEGSFSPAYSHHEVTNYSPPTLLPYILNSSDTSFNHIRETLQSFSYIGIFPLSSHIREVLVPCLPPVEHLYLQMTPQTPDFRLPGNPIRGEIADLWLEFDTAYSFVMRQIFDREVRSVWKQLQAFESGDAFNDEGWSMAMQYIQVHGLKGWKMKRKGYFVRNEYNP